MQKKTKWPRLPGFRSATRWKLVTAALVYALVLIGVITLVFRGEPAENTSIEDAANSDAKNCSDFDDDQQLYNYWTKQGYSSENDPDDLDANGDGVPCAVLSENMEDEFTVYEKKQTGKTAEAEVPSYTLYKGENNRYENGVYLNYYVIPDADPASIEESDIDTISDEVIMNAKEQEPFHLLTINFVDAEKAMDYGSYVYGKTDYFPNGDIGAAEDYERGDYSDHEINTIYGSMNNEGLPKQPDEYPSEKQLNMYFYWAGPAYEEGLESNSSPMEATADKFGVSVEKVEQALQKASNR